MNDEYRSQIRNLDYQNRVTGNMTRRQINKDIKNLVEEDAAQRMSKALSNNQHVDLPAQRTLDNFAESESSITVKDAISKYGLTLAEIQTYFAVDATYDITYHTSTGIVEDYKLRSPVNHVIHMDDLIPMNELIVYMDMKGRIQ